MIVAALGPTNTGKTHRAVERMLEHESGMIGLPLRLLAREVYDRIAARIGEGRVALVTGEEQRVPRRPSYWVSTVEAMPVEREVDFVAVDEIQLAAHDQRGHVFTDRMLSARGKRETWLMGAATMRDVVRDLVPTAKILEHPRLSTLTWIGPKKLTKMPPKSAIVAFSTAQVYALGERVRARTGGAAVVLGALSPRTRNAQVALFQAGEVDHLVATDAIGMGLNLDLLHVAFAGLSKFDGRDLRGLDAAELAQIAGRAGRSTADGTFGTLAPLDLPPSDVSAIEAHRFSPVKRVRWRSTDLDFSSADALLASLDARPRSSRLVLATNGEDHAALARLARDPKVRSRAAGREAVALLWEVCRIPDYKRILFEAHTALLAELYDQLAGPRAALDVDWVAARVAEIDDPTGDIDTLTSRIAAIRTFTYVSQRSAWLPHADEWRERTRAIEDRLSDALHDRLVQRFVERGRRAARPSPPKPKPRHHDRAEPAPEPRRSSPFAQLEALRDKLAPQPVEPTIVDRDVEAIVAATHDRFTVSATGAVSLLADAGAIERPTTIAKLVRGAGLLLPNIKLTAQDALGAGAKLRIERRMVAYARDLAAELLAPLRSVEAKALSAAGRGLLYLVEQGLGTALTEGVNAQVTSLTNGDRELLSSLGVVVGARVIYVDDLLDEAAMTVRSALVTAWLGATPKGIESRPISLPFDPSTSAEALLAVGYPVFGTRALRADVAESVYQALAREGPDNPAVAKLAGCSPRELPWIAAALG